MERNRIILLFIFFISICFSGCKKHHLACKTAKISIENRWSDLNGGLDYLNVKNDVDVNFICKRINDFSRGEEVRISYSYGDIDIYMDHIKIQAIFTYKNGVVYRVGAGKYVHDEALTQRIIKLMKIKERCWGEDCK